MTQRLSELWTAAAPTLESTSREVVRKMRSAGGSAKQQWAEMMGQRRAAERHASNKACH